MINNENNEILITNQCEACALFKAHKIIFRSSDKEEASKAPFHRIIYDLVPLTSALNKHQKIIFVLSEYFAHFDIM